MKPADLTETQQGELITAFNDHGRFCRESINIRNPVGSNVPMILSPGQDLIGRAIRRQRAKRKPVRLVVLKTRRSQFTSGVTSEIFHEVAFFPGRRATIIADHYNPAGMEAFDYLIQFDMSYRPFGAGMFDGLEGIRKPALIKPANPQTPVPEGIDLQMLWDNKSSVDVLSADRGDVGRGGGRHWVLFDELAWARAAKLTMNAILNMVPDDPETAVVLQSTANGMGGPFYDLCQAAQDPSNEFGFEFVFFGWLSHPPYRMAVEGDPAKFQASLNTEERLLMAMHSATLEQLAWRRWKIATSCAGDVELFHQEYPTTPAEAFLLSGRPVFSHTDLAKHPVRAGSSGELKIEERGALNALVWLPRDDDKGVLTIWKRPERGVLYCGAADPSQGKDVSMDKRGSNPDFSVSGIAETLTGEMCALYRARTRPGQFAIDVALLCRWFNWAFLTPEANDAGFIDALVNTGYPLEQIYNRRRDPTDRRPSRIQEIGFETTPLTRSWLVGAAEEAVRDLTIIIRSQVVIGECQTFVVKPNGKHEHMDEKHDDCVLMLGLLEICRRVAPRKPPPSLQPLPRRQYVEVGKRLRPEEEE